MYKIIAAANSVYCFLRFLSRFFCSLLHKIKQMPAKDILSRNIIFNAWPAAESFVFTGDDIVPPVFGGVPGDVPGGISVSFFSVSFSLSAAGGSVSDSVDCTFVSVSCGSGLVCGSVRG